MDDLSNLLHYAATCQPCRNCSLKAYCGHDDNTEATIANCVFMRASKLLKALAREGEE